MPKRRKPALVLPAPIQLPLFAEAATLVRILPERDKHRYYRLEVWPDLFGRALLVCRWGRVGARGCYCLDPHPDPGAPSMHSLLAPGPSGAAAIVITQHEQVVRHGSGDTESKNGSAAPEPSPGTSRPWTRYDTPVTVRSTGMVREPARAPNRP